MSAAAELAQRCSDSQGSRQLDGLAFKLLCGKPGDVWSDDVGSDGVWCRQDPEDTVAYDTPPELSTSLDAAMAIDVGPDVRLVSLREHVRSDGSIGDPSWREWAVTMEVRDLYRIVEASAHTAALAMLAAKIKVHDLRGS